VPTSEKQRPLLLNAQQAAELLGVGKSTFRQVVEAGGVRQIKLAGIGPRYSREALEALARGEEAGE
jgi:excisionase family DNA binding protein